jgi:hypothetical protein
MKYRYGQYGEYLVCVNQSILSAVRTLLIGFDRHRLDSLGLTKRAAWHAIKFLVKKKLSPGDPQDYLALPAFGHFGMKVHRGYKLFDLVGSEVTKVFNAEILPDEAREEIRASRIASSIALAPRHLLSDSKCTWFKEEYIRGTHATSLVSPGSSDFLRYYPDAAECLIELIGIRKPLVVDATEYIETLATDDFRDRWLNADIPSEEVDRIAEYIESTRQSLMAHAEVKELQLVLTHGDFSLVNAIHDGERLRFIDWEGVGAGSIYSDILNFGFAEHYYGRTSAEFGIELASMIEKFRSAVLAEFPELEAALAVDEDYYRRLYYLERVRLMIDRDVSLNLNSVVAKSIAMFEQFDRDDDNAEP